MGLLQQTGRLLYESLLEFLPGKLAKETTPDGARTHNPWFRKPVPHPLGHWGFVTLIFNTIFTSQFRPFTQFVSMGHKNNLKHKLCLLHKSNVKIKVDEYALRHRYWQQDCTRLIRIKKKFLKWLFYANICFNRSTQISTKTLLLLLHILWQM